MIDIVGLAESERRVPKGTIRHMSGDIPDGWDYMIVTTDPGVRSQKVVIQSMGVTNISSSSYPQAVPVGDYPVRATWKVKEYGLWHTLVAPGVQRTNYIPRSFPTIAQLSSKGTGVSDASAPTGAGFSGGAIQFPASSNLEWAYQSISVALTDPVISVYVAMDDGSIPRIGTMLGADIDFKLIANSTGSLYNCYVYATDIPGVYRVASQVSGSTTPGNNFGVARYADQSGKGFRVLGFMVEPGTINVTEAGRLIVTTGSSRTVTDMTYNAETGVATLGDSAPSVSVNGFLATGSGATWTAPASAKPGPCFAMLKTPNLTYYDEATGSWTSANIAAAGDTVDLFRPLTYDKAVCCVTNTSAVRQIWLYSRTTNTSTNVTPSPENAQESIFTDVCPGIGSSKGGFLAFCHTNPAGTVWTTIRYYDGSAWKAAITYSWIRFVRKCIALSDGTFFLVLVDDTTGDARCAVYTPSTNTLVSSSARTTSASSTWAVEAIQYDSNTVMAAVVVNTTVRYMYYSISSKTFWWSNQYTSLGTALNTTPKMTVHKMRDGVVYVVNPTNAVNGQYLLRQQADRKTQSVSVTVLNPTSGTGPAQYCVVDDDKIVATTAGDSTTKTGFAIYWWTTGTVTTGTLPGSAAVGGAAMVQVAKNAVACIMGGGGTPNNNCYAFNVDALLPQLHTMRGAAGSLGYAKAILSADGTAAMIFSVSGAATPYFVNLESLKAGFSYYARLKG